MEVKCIHEGMAWWCSIFCKQNRCTAFNGCKGVERKNCTKLNNPRAHLHKHTHKHRLTASAGCIQVGVKLSTCVQRLSSPQVANNRLARTFATGMVIKPPCCLPLACEAKRVCFSVQNIRVDFRCWPRNVAHRRA